MSSAQLIIAELYQSESSKILAVLLRVLGAHNFELAEDILQDVFDKALCHWDSQAPPANPSAWLIQVAKNQAVDTIRSMKTRHKFADDLSHFLESEWSLESTIQHEFEGQQIKDDQLRMIFWCCQEGLKKENVLPFVLRVLCGLSINAISRALMQPEATIKKRLQRTKEKLKHCEFAMPAKEELIHAMDVVHTTLYLLFNEGFHCSDEQQAINRLLCREAISLVNLLIDEPHVANQDTFALLALMYFHMARIESRLDPDGNNIPIDLQDRALWDQRTIQAATYTLSVADELSPGESGRFLLEAKIAREHCQAKGFDETNWPLIVNLYKDLAQLTQSPVVQLNQAIAMAYTGEVLEAIRQVESLQTHPALKHSHMTYAILAHLHAKLGHSELAYEMACQAKSTGGTPYEHRVMMEQLKRLLGVD